MAFPGGPLPSPIPDRRKTPPAGDRLRGRNLLSGTTFCLMGELSFSLLLYLRVFAVPGVQPLNRHTCGANSSLCIAAVDFLRASALSGPVSVPPHGWPEPTPAPRRCPRSHLQQDTGTVPCGAETPRGRSQLQHPAGRDSTPSPMRQTPLPNRPINECGTGACYGSRERVFVSHPRFPSLFSANHAVVFGGLCVPTPTPAFIGRKP
jgi:hypothetical protein